VNSKIAIILKAYERYFNYYYCANCRL